MFERRSTIVLVVYGFAIFVYIVAPVISGSGVIFVFVLVVVVAIFAVKAFQSTIFVKR